MNSQGGETALCLIATAPSYLVSTLMLRRSLKAKSFIVSSVNVLHQLINIGAVAFGCHFQSFFKGLTTSQQATKA